MDWFGNNDKKKNEGKNGSKKKKNRVTDMTGGGFWMNNVGMAVNSTTPVLVQVSAQPTKLPLWLPSGATLAVGTKVSSISVVEFNIIP